MYSFLNIKIPNYVKEQLIEEFYTLPQGYEVYIRNEWVDQYIIALHSSVLLDSYGYHNTSYMHNEDKNIPHSDPRPAALNFGLLNCTDTTHTVFFNKGKNSLVNIKSAHGNTRASYYPYGLIESCRFNLLDDQCVLLNTSAPHRVDNFLPIDKKRIVLSIDCKVSYDEAANYFNSLGLLE